MRHLAVSSPPFPFARKFAIFGQKRHRFVWEYIYDNFTVAPLAIWPLNGSEARGDFVLIQTFLLFTSKSCCSYAKKFHIMIIYTWKASSFNKTKSTPSSCPLRGQGTTKWGGGGGAGGQEVYGRREKRGREAGFPRWREAGEKGGNYATLRNISQSKKCKGAGAKKYRAGSGRFKPPCPLPPY